MWWCWNDKTQHKVQFLKFLIVKLIKLDHVTFRNPSGDRKDNVALHIFLESTLSCSIYQIFVLLNYSTVWSDSCYPPWAGLRFFFFFLNLWCQVLDAKSWVKSANATAATDANVPAVKAWINDLITLVPIIKSLRQPHMTVAPAGRRLYASEFESWCLERRWGRGSATA